MSIAPSYWKYHGRPVRVVRTEDGGMTVERFDSETGEWERRLGILSAILGGDPDADELTEEDFDRCLAALRSGAGGDEAWERVLASSSSRTALPGGPTWSSRGHPTPTSTTRPCRCWDATRSGSSLLRRPMHNISSWIGTRASSPSRPGRGCSSVPVVRGSAALNSWHEMPGSNDQIPAQEAEELATTPERSRLMAKVRQKDTPPELAVRRLVNRLGHRFRVGAGDLPGTPDLANRRHRWAIFVHGCYWHAHQGCSRWRLPKRNRAFWRRKFEANRSRDLRVLGELEELGFRILVVWECELEDFEPLTRKLQSFLNDGQGGGSS